MIESSDMGVPLEGANTSKLSAITGCLSSLSAMLETVDCSDRAKSVVSFLRSLDGRIKDMKGAKDPIPVVWSPAIVTTPTSNYFVDPSKTSPSFSLPESSQFRSMYSGPELTKAKLRNRKQTFAEFLKETENKPETQDINAQEMPSAHGPMLFDDDDEYFVEEMPVIDVYVQDQRSFVSQSENAYSSVLPKEDKAVFDSIVVETTAVEDITSDEKAFKIVVTGIDVALFLFEALIKSIFPVIFDGGRQAFKRVVQTLGVRRVRIPLAQWIASRKRGRDTTEETEWELLEGLENLKSV